MTALAWLVSIGSVRAYSKTRDDTHFYFSITFFFFGLYLFVLFLITAVNPLIEYIVPLLSVARIMIFLAFIFLLRTPVYQGNDIFRKNTITISVVVILVAILSTVIRLSAGESLITHIGIIIPNLPIYISIPIGLISIFFAISWSWLLLKNMSPNSSVFFKSKIYILCLGALTLGLGDLVYIISDSLAQSAFGSTLSTAGYFIIVLSILLSDVRRLLLNFFKK